MPRSSSSSTMRRTGLPWSATGASCTPIRRSPDSPALPTPDSFPGRPWRTSSPPSTGWRLPGSCPCTSASLLRKAGCGCAAEAEARSRSTWPRTPRLSRAAAQWCSRSASRLRRSESPRLLEPLRRNVQAREHRGLGIPLVERRVLGDGHLAPRRTDPQGRLAPVGGEDPAGERDEPVDAGRGEERKPLFQIGSAARIEERSPLEKEAVALPPDDAPRPGIAARPQRRDERHVVVLEILVDVGGKLVLASARVAVPLEQLLVADRGVVEINRQEHVVAGEQEILESEDGAVLQGEMDAPRALDGFQVLDDPVEVELPVVDAGEERVALQVVHPIRVELAAHDLPQERKQIAISHREWAAARRLLAADQGRDVGRLDPSRAHPFRDLRREPGVEDELQRVVLVIRLPPWCPALLRLGPLRDPQLQGERHDPLGRVGERRMA